MPEGPDGKTIIIVKKVTGHAGHHGGAWKVAYADFVTAMMALFMVLWLINTASVTTREKIASYFQRAGVFESGSGAPIEVGGGGILSDVYAPPGDNNSQLIPAKNVYKLQTDGGPLKEGFAKGSGEGGEAVGGGRGDSPAAKALIGLEQAGFEQAANEINKLIKEAREAAALAALKSAGIKEGAEIGAAGNTLGGKAGAGEGVPGLLGDVEIKIDQRGLHIEIMDTEKTSMFLVSSAVILGDAERELAEIGKVLSKLPNPIDIEGHTDAKPFRGTRATSYDNWNLSTDRANAARRVLQDAGVQDWQINRVVGYADQRPKLPENPLDDANRRITISMRYTEEAAAALEGNSVKEFENEATKGPYQDSSVPEVVLPELKDSVDEQTEGSLSSFTAQLESSTKVESSSGLDVELNTRVPEGAKVVPRQSKESGEIWNDKDKIFGGENPFF